MCLQTWTSTTTMCDCCATTLLAPLVTVPSAFTVITLKILYMWVNTCVTTCNSPQTTDKTLVFVANYMLWPTQPCTLSVATLRYPYRAALTLCSIYKCDKSLHSLKTASGRWAKTTWLLRLKWTTYCRKPSLSEPHAWTTMLSTNCPLSYLKAVGAKGVRPMPWCATRLFGRNIAQWNLAKASRRWTSLCIAWNKWRVLSTLSSA